MLRTRAAILAAAESCVARVGARRTTMRAVSAAGGIAKATLYNHFRTKSDLLEGLALARVDELATRGMAAAGGGLAPAPQLAAGGAPAPPPPPPPPGAGAAGRPPPPPPRGAPGGRGA